MVTRPAMVSAGRHDRRRGGVPRRRRRDRRRWRPAPGGSCAAPTPSRSCTARWSRRPPACTTDLTGAARGPDRERRSPGRRRRPARPGGRRRRLGARLRRPGQRGSTRTSATSASPRSTGSSSTSSRSPPARCRSACPTGTWRCGSPGGSGVAAGAAGAERQLARTSRPGHRLRLVPHRGHVALADRRAAAGHGLRAEYDAGSSTRSWTAA